jgi:hypothetical protein
MVRGMEGEPEHISSGHQYQQTVRERPPAIVAPLVSPLLPHCPCLSLPLPDLPLSSPPLAPFPPTTPLHFPSPSPPTPPPPPTCRAASASSLPNASTAPRTALATRSRQARLEAAGITK